jgi:asparagine synthase (glutamine-hydrolysing)
MTAHVDGAAPTLVRDAIDRGDALPGTRGFAGRVDGGLVRDVLGRYPLYYDANGEWSFAPTELGDPRPVPAGHVVDDEPRRLWSLPDPDPGTSDTSAVEGALRTAVDRVDTGDLAIAFSGGLDSAVLAARFDAPLYVVGFPDSHDVEAARSAAARLGRDCTVVRLDHDTLERVVPRVARATGRANAMDVSIATALYCVAEAAADDGFDRLALGQGADELFGGYAKIASAPSDQRVAADTVREARRETIESLPAQLPRDVLATRAAGPEPIAPFLDDGVVEAALGLATEDLVSPTGERKSALRRAARAWLPDALAFREKKAIQYGSLVLRELDRLARRAGFKRRQDDHVGSYVASLLD